VSYIKVQISFQRFRLQKTKSATLFTISRYKSPWELSSLILRACYHPCTHPTIVLTNTLTAIFLTFTFVAAGPIVKRSVLSDLDTIASDLQTLQSDVSSWDGSLLTALPLLSDVDTAENDIQVAINDTQESPTFSSSDSTSMTNEVVALEPIITSTLNDLLAKVCLPECIKPNGIICFCFT
jgi:hypothetical protein